MADPPLVGKVVRSICGRDKGRLAVVVGVLDERYVQVADGEMRRVSKPKKKNKRHLQVLSLILASNKNSMATDRALTDEEVARRLASVKT